MSEEFPTFDKLAEFSDVEAGEVFVPISHEWPFRKESHGGYNAVRRSDSKQAHFEDTEPVARRTGHMGHSTNVLAAVLLSLLMCAVLAALAYTIMLAR